MARYFFHIDGQKPHQDEVGEDLLDDGSAWLTAMRLSRDIESNLQPGQEWKLDVRRAATLSIPSRSKLIRTDENGIIAGGAPTSPGYQHLLRQVRKESSWKQIGTRCRLGATYEYCRRSGVFCSKGGLDCGSVRSRIGAPIMRRKGGSKWPDTMRYHAATC